MNSSSTNPCKGCGNRKVGCHSSCEDYIFWKTEYNKKKQKIFEAKKANKLSGAFQRDSYTRYLKWKKGQ